MTKLVIMLPSVDDKTCNNAIFMQMTKLVIMLSLVDDKTDNNAIFSR